MGNFTRSDDPRLDALVLSHLEIVREVVLKYIQPQALLLAGSFGRGEGSIMAIDSGFVYFSDYEICLVHPSLRARRLMDQIAQELRPRIPVEISLFWNSPARIRYNRSRNLSFGKPQPTIGMYELKAASYVFYGAQDLLSTAIDPKTLPLSEGVRLVANRMMELMETWVRRPVPEAMAMPLAKLVLACGDALLLRAGCYHYSYFERKERLTRHYEEHIAPVVGMNFLPIYCNAAQAKLNPRPAPWCDVPATLAAIAPISQKVLACLTSSPPRADRIQIARRCAGNIPLLYHTGLWSELDHFYEDLILWARSLRAYHRIYWRNLCLLKGRLTPFQALYAVIPLLFWGTTITGEGDPAALEQAAVWSRWALPQANIHSQHELTTRMLEMWHIFG